MKKVLLALFSLTIMIGCSDSTSENQEQTIVAKPTNLELLKREASRLRAGGSIKTVELNENTVLIEYVKNYEEYKKLNPHSGLTEEDLMGYWSTSEAVEKALVDGSVRLMKKLEFVDQVKINLPVNESENTIVVTKSELEKFIGSDFNTIINNWEKMFSEPYVYDKVGRQKFLEKFGK